MTKKPHIIGSIVFGIAVLLLGAALLSGGSLNVAQEIVAEEAEVIAQDTANEEATAPVPQPIEPMPQDQNKVFGAKEFTLENGLRGIVIPNHRAPVVTHMVWYKAGAADEPRGKSGIAHFMEHLMFKGSQTITGTPIAAGDFSKIIRSLGGQDNAFTGQDYTAYYQSAASEYLETLMQMEAGRMKSFMPHEEEIASERLVILEERSQRTDNTPEGKFEENMMAGLYVNHPYGTPIIGWRHEMETLTRQDALDFHTQYYAPNNAILVVAGDVTLEQVKEYAAQTYGTIPARTTPARTRTELPPLDGHALYRLESPDVKQAEWQRIYAAPSMRTDKDTAFTLQVLQEIMGGGANSRLYKALVIDQKLASNASLFYRADGWSESSLYIVATPLPHITMEQITEAVAQEIETLVRDGVSEDELSDAITRMQDSAVYARDSLRGPAMALGSALATGGTLANIEYWPELIGKVTANDVKQAAQDYLSLTSDKARFVTGYLEPQTNAPVKTIQEERTQ